MYIVPAFKDNLQVKKGRGKGGLATLWDKSLTKDVHRVSCLNYRLQATRFDFPFGRLLLLNTYFPCDPQSVNFDETELLSLLADMKRILQQESCELNLIMGDMNCHFDRNNAHTRIVEYFFDELNLKIFWENPDERPDHLVSKIDFTHCQIKDIIDHFVANNLLYDKVVEANVVHSAENNSNHSAIYTKLKFDRLDHSIEVNINPRKISWAKASEEAKENYRITLDNYLSNIQIPECISCLDLQCQIHNVEIENYTLNLMEAIETAAKDCLPLSGGSKGSAKSPNCTSGWSEFVTPFAEENKFWHAVWESAGKPREGQLFEIMKKNKCRYKYAIRRIKKANQSIQNDKFIQGLLQGGASIFDEIKRFRGQINGCSSMIDNEVGSQNIVTTLPTSMPNYTVSMNIAVTFQFYARKSVRLSVKIQLWMLTELLQQL